MYLCCTCSQGRAQVAKQRAQRPRERAPSNAGRPLRRQVRDTCISQRACPTPAHGARARARARALSAPLLPVQAPPPFRQLAAPHAAATFKTRGSRDRSPWCASSGLVFCTWQQTSSQTALHQASLACMSDMSLSASSATAAARAAAEMASLPKLCQWLHVRLLFHAPAARL